MSSSSIKSIIVLMSISLIGLISFQAYWLSHSISRESAKFDQDMQALVAEVAENIEQQEAYNLVQGHDLVVTDTVELSSISEISPEVRKIIAQIGTGSISTSSTEESKTVIVTSDGANTTIIQQDGPSISSTSATVIENGVIKKFQSKKELLTKVVDEIAYEFAFSDLSLSERLKDISIDTIIQNNLNRVGYEFLDYSFRIKEEDSDSIIKKGGAFNSVSDAQYYGTTIGKNSSTLGKLALFIPNRTSLILKSLWLTLLLSFILTLILISTFIYTINSIIKQKRISQMKADFINNMTHEFKTPVATISLAIDSILHKEIRNKPEEIEKLGGIIKKENGRMNQQIESLLEIAMFDKQSFQFNLQVIYSHQTIKELKETFDIKIIDQQGDIALFLDAKHDQIYADSMHFYNALRNIIDNSIKFSDSSFRIKIRTYNENNALVIEISDRGIGMNKETQSRIFDRFYRKQEGDLHPTKGFGLGLAYVKEVIEKLHGKVTVQSELGKGSTFLLKIPLK